MKSHTLLSIPAQAGKGATTLLFVSVCVLSYLSGCANDGRGAGGNPSDSLPPVEKKSPNSDYKPAFAGQTRIAGVKTNTPYTVEKIGTKLGHPFAIVAMPDGRVMVPL